MDYIEKLEERYKKEIGGEFELKPCPFCGAKAFVWYTNHRMYIECENFNAAGHMIRISNRNAKDAVDAWNRRN